jgi:hypothetical protein
VARWSAGTCRPATAASATSRPPSGGWRCAGGWPAATATRSGSWSATSPTRSSGRRHGCCFLECNPVDLQRGLAQLQRDIPVGLQPLLLEEARADPTRLGGADALFTPYFHLAEARELAPAGSQVVPLNFVPSEETMRTLVDVPADALVGVVAVDARSRRRLEAIVQQFSPAAVRSALLDDPQAVAHLVEAADLVLATNAAKLPEELLRRVRRLLRIGWTMEGGLAREGSGDPEGIPRRTGRAGAGGAVPA